MSFLSVFINFEIKLRIFDEPTVAAGTGGGVAAAASVGTVVGEEDLDDDAMIDLSCLVWFLEMLLLEFLLWG